MWPRRPTPWLPGSSAGARARFRATGWGVVVWALACSGSSDPGPPTTGAPPPVVGAPVVGGPGGTPNISALPRLQPAWHVLYAAGVATPTRIPIPSVGADAARAYAYVAGSLTAYDLATGTQRWQVAGLRGAPQAVVSDGAVVLHAAVSVTALDAGTGAVRWTATPPNYVGDAAPVEDGARVYVGTSVRNGQPPPVVVAYDRATGRPAWTAPVGAEWTYRSAVSGITLANGLLVVAATECRNDGCGAGVSWLIALDPASGAERWRVQLGTPETLTMVVRPAAWGGRLVLASDYTGNTVFAVDAARHRVAWHPALHANMGGPADAPVVDTTAGVAYVGSGDGYVYALDLATGVRRWESPVGSAINAFARCGGTLAAQALRLITASPVDGRLLGAAYTEQSEFTVGNLAVANGRLVVGTTAGLASFACP